MLAQLRPESNMNAESKDYVTRQAEIAKRGMLAS